MCVYYIQLQLISPVLLWRCTTWSSAIRARGGAAAQAAHCDRMLHPEETTNLADFKLPNPDTRLVVFGDAVFKLKYKLR